MNNELVSKVLSAILKSKGQAEITVMGISMNPTLFEGDKVIIKKSSEYRIGDIIVFNYKNEGILIHRLLKYDGRYFCKGDNALRLEDIEYNQIIGKAVLVNNTTIQPWDDWKVRLSYSLNREFVKLRYNMDKIKKSNIYRIYSVLILRKEENKMGKIKVTECGGIKGLKVVEPTVFGDARGYFMETYNYNDFKEAGIDVEFVQDNQSSSHKGVLRGLHFQINYPQDKLVRVVNGEVFDVAVDLREGSETYGKWFGVVLSAENKKQFFIPKGFAHGFLVLSEHAEFVYKCSDFYHPNDEGGLIWNDPDIGVEWPIPEGMELSFSDKDTKWGSFKEYRK